MGNPFILYSQKKKIHYLSPLCSINKLVIKKLPIYGIDDSIEGKAVSQIISAKIIAKETARKCREAGIDVSGYNMLDMPVLISKGYNSEDPIARAVYRDLAICFGNRLGLILLTLKKGDIENRLARPEWDEKHWDYFKTVENIILTGGLTSSMLGKCFKSQIQYVFDSAGVKPYNIMIFENCSYIGVMGCASLVKEKNCVAPLLDCGQTGIKRCTIQIANGEISSINQLSSLPSMYMELYDNDMTKAIQLHKYIINAAAQTYKAADVNAKASDTIIISIANYVEGGTLNSERGGYAKLSLLGDDYSELLGLELSSYLHKPVNVQLVHDATAVGLYFHGQKNAVCLTIGTGFGIGFPEFEY